MSEVEPESEGESETEYKFEAESKYASRKRLTQRDTAWHSAFVSRPCTSRRSWETEKLHADFYIYQS
jgi:hypothetical protein